MALADSRDALRDILISGTVQHAAENSEFYRILYRDVDIAAIQDSGDLRRLPIVHKEQLCEAGQSVLCENQTCKSILNTSGSTGQPLLHYHSWEEHDFIQSFFEKALEESQVDVKPLVLNITVPRHGPTIEIPSNAFILTTGLLDNEMVRHAVQMLTREFNLPGVASRVTHLASTHSQLLQLTAYVIEQGYKPEDFALKSVIITSRYLTRRLSSLLSRVWGAKIIDEYGLTEIFGGATRCSYCDHFHFEPYVIPEVVDLSTHEPLQEGTGALLLTSLYPFSQMQPFIRYWTGDLFTCAEGRCMARQFTYQGRIGHSLFAPGKTSTPLLTGVEVLEAVDSFPEVRRDSLRPPVGAVYDKSVSGHPVMRGKLMPGSPARVEIRLETHVTPGLFPEWETNFRQTVRESFLKTSTTLREAVNSGEIEFDVLLMPPTSLPISSDEPEKGLSIWR